ncbi:MAG: hypothetical protein A3H71_01595 [Candidatus Sungbacteria bacterium RIFCSPLOWO2_02_FULL_48_13b]|uniref:Phage holin family protein n=1 Tax=Candidatus Sungbacteria bacterium RIFCSPLOWO2_02_FULL_48_13b TaxID=1802283 RepID=A0A1G2LFY2_9BACT|nr:MAG: hypothetical protein A3H71_01595 [Candidatus Sungbacteria bacterium RIFCSPLOWO2_02_FULL_48_13b]
MRFISHFVLRVGLNGLILWVLPQFLAGFTVSQEWQLFAGAALVLALVHSFLRPILKLISFPFLILTLGLFNIVINFVLLLVAEHLTSAITIADFNTRLIASLIIGIINSVI